MLYRIGEVSELIGVSNETLRNYERAGIICSHRKEGSNIRYYDIETISKLIGIRTRRNEGFSMEELQRVYTDITGEDYEALLREKIDRMEQEKVSPMGVQFILIQMIASAFRVLYALAGLYLLSHAFSYTAYLGFSLLLSLLGAFDSLAYNSLYPNLIPEGCEQKGFSVGAMLYPIVTVVVTPLAAVLYERLGVALLLVGQGALGQPLLLAQSGDPGAAQIVFSILCLVDEHKTPPKMTFSACHFRYFML